ncbi:hypothetical protein [Winogradskyella alexanderae]|uniref:Ubiquitin-like domain-containing protein n=1 Tax=Winogradskyella alexanderae TaxID=2877123 RepID=A0ABS7XYK7_9FLAO|nr:hypothetical protein [Winogradskyella alexanderae]MCA0133871.1 hypothetical protein [Winogradskyella alexanderae]
MTNIEIIGLAASLSSLILAVLAIWFSFYNKKQADKVNEETRNLLIDVKSDAKTISQVAMPELKAYGDTMRKFVTKSDNPSFIDNVSNSLQETISKSLLEIKEEINTMKTSEISNELKTQLDKLGRLTNETEEKVTEKVKYVRETITIDLNEINRKSEKLHYHYYSNLQSLINDIFIKFLSDLLPVWSYGNSWILINQSNSLPIKTYKDNDERSLSEAGIKPGDILIVETI